MVHLLVRDDSNQWHKLVLTSDFSIDYVVENNLFTEGESYTLDIDLPFENNTNKILRDQRTKWFGRLVLDNISKTGFIYVTAKKRATVSVQFVERRASDILDETYINIMSLPNYHTEKDCSSTYGPDSNTSVRLPWFDNTAQVHHPCTWTISEPTNLFEGMPFLIKLTRDILERVDFDADLSIWDRTTFRYLIACNVLPRSWGLNGGYENSLPNWTIREYLIQLGHLLHGVFFIDDNQRLITFKFYGALQRSIPIRKIDVFDDYEMSVEDVSDCKYDGAMNIRFADLESEPCGKYYSCEDEVKMLVQKYGQTNVSIYPMRQWYIFPDYLPYSDVRSHRLFFDQTTQRYFIPLFDLPPQSASELICDVRYKALNLFAPVKRNNSDEFEEVKIIPVSVDWHVKADNDYNHYIILSPKKNENAPDPDEDHRCPAIENAFNNAVEADGRVEYYDKIYVGFWYIDEHAVSDRPDWDESVYLDYSDNPAPAVSRIKILEDGGFVKIYQSHYDLSLGENENVVGDDKVVNIDPECLYKFSFLSHDIPDTRGIFIIHGEKYICKQLKTVFTAKSGKSECIEGEFYKVV